MAHGQKKRRKRSLNRTFTLDEVCLAWQLLSEPQWTTEDGYRGLRISIRTQEGSHRELILEFPFPKKMTGIGIPQLPQRPQFSEQSIKDGVRQALAAGWEPQSRGKTFVYKISI